MNRYEIVVKIEEIIKLADMKKYKEACEILDTINTSKMKKYEDLIIFAEVYLKNKRYLEAKEILKRMHEKTTTRRLLTLLISVNSKMHNYVEAEECYREYVKIAPRDVNRFILRYKIDKAKGLGYDALIKPLEQLKEYDLIEEWEYELAKLYHKAGYGDKCISECNTIIMMFGTGAIVEKAKLLRDHHIDALIQDDDENANLAEFNATVQLDNIIGKVRRKLGVEDSEPIESSNSEDYGEGVSISPQIEDEYAKDNDKITDKFFKNGSADEEEDEVEAAILKELQEEEVDELDVKFDKGNFFLKGKEQRKKEREEKETEEVKEAKVEDQEPANETKEETNEVESEKSKEESEEDLFGKDEVETFKTEAAVENKSEGEIDDDFLNSISDLVSSQVDLLIDEAKQELGKEEKENKEESEPETIEVKEEVEEEPKSFEAKEDVKEDTKVEVEEETKAEETKVKVEEDTKAEETKAVVEEDTKAEETKAEVKEDVKAEEIKAEVEHEKPLKVVTIDGVEPILTDEEYNRIMEKLTVLLTPSMYDDFNEKDINENNFRNFYSIPYLRANIKCALGNTERNVVKGNFIICGNAKSGRTTIAKMIAKEAYGRDIIETSKVARIEASKFNSVDLGLKQSKLADGCLIIQNAHELSINAMTALITMIIHLNGRILVFLETDYDNIASLYILTEEVREYFNSVVTTPEYSEAELIGFARSYAAYKGYSFSENGIKAMEELIESVYNKISLTERVPFVLTAIEKSIRASQNRNKGFGRTNYDGLNVLDVQDVEQQYI